MVNLKEYKGFFVICLLIAILIVVVYVFTLFWPKYEEHFFELGMLGSNKKAEDYFLGNTSDVEVGSKLVWYIYLGNHMGSPQNVIVRVKLLNSTMTAPDDRAHEPSPYTVSFEVPVSLAVDETTLVPFVWKVSEANYLNGSMVIKGLLINDVPVAVNASSLVGSRFKLVFELWVYDQSLGNYRFFWASKGELYSASIYLWFSVTSPG
jgi:uncharacterized membrane protein